MIYEITNPSDTYTLKADNLQHAIAAVILLGKGQYGLTEENGETVCPLFILGGVDEWFTEHYQMNFEKFMEINLPFIPDILDTVIIGPISDRQEIDEAVSMMSKDDANTFLDKRHDRRRTSTNDIGGRAKLYAKLLREKGENQ